MDEKEELDLAWPAEKKVVWLFKQVLELAESGARDQSTSDEGDSQFKEDAGLGLRSRDRAALVSELAARGLPHEVVRRAAFAGGSETELALENLKDLPPGELEAATRTVMQRLGWPGAQDANSTGGAMLIRPTVVEPPIPDEPPPPPPAEGPRLAGVDYVAAGAELFRRCNASQPPLCAADLEARASAVLVHWHYPPLPPGAADAVMHGDRIPLEHELVAYEHVTTGRRGELLDVFYPPREDAAPRAALGKHIEALVGAARRILQGLEGGTPAESAYLFRGLLPPLWAPSRVYERTQLRDEDVERLTGTRIREYRDAHGLSVRELARLTGLKQAILSHYETGRRRVSKSNAARLLEFFQKNP